MRNSALCLQMHFTEHTIRFFFYQFIEKKGKKSMDVGKY